jgi:hypothetical protein
MVIRLVLGKPVVRDSVGVEELLVVLMTGAVNIRHIMVPIMQKNHYKYM